jgi:hypothetical protein
MNFCIGTVVYFNSIGFDTSIWRKSIDGTKTIVHAAFVKILIPDIENDTNLQIYMSPSAELKTLLNSPEWNVNELN